MFENVNSMFNGMFGKIAPGMCRLTMNGNIAVKCSKGYKTYNVNKETLTNVSNFCFNIGEEFFFVLPTNKVEKGDIILVDGKPKCVIKVDKKIITVIDYENSEIRQIVPERHVFMGSTYFYGKIVSMLGNNFKKGKGISSVLKMMMMSQMFGGKSSDNSMMGMMPMMMMMGKENPFENMLDGFSFDSDDSEDTCDEDTDNTENNNDED